MNSFIELLAGSWFALGLLKSTALALIGGAFISCLRQRDLASGLWAGLALLIPVAFFSGLLPLSWKALPPVVETPTPVILRTDRHPAVAPMPTTLEDLPDEPIDEAADLTVEAPAPLVPQAMTVASRTPFSRGQWLVGLWIAGGAATLVPGLLTLLASRRLNRSMAPKEITTRWNSLAGNKANGVRTWISPDVTTPGITSALRPQVILPESAFHWETDRLMSVLRHELHHLKRHDLALRWLGRMARAVLWFHPAAWWVQSRLVLAQERAADEAVVAAGVPAADYAGHLLETAAESRLFPGIAMARRSQVGGRIHLLLARREGASHWRTAGERAASALMGGFAMVLAIIGFSTPQAARAEAPAELADKGFRPPILDRNGKLIATSDPARMPEELRAHPPLRWYPEGEALGHVSGFVLPDKGQVQVAKGWGLEDSEELARGTPLRSTIDVEIQRLAWNELETLKKPGSVIVMDPRNGEVLAMASWPSFNPNEYAEGVTPEEWRQRLADPQKPLSHRALAIEPPGSFAKLVVALAAASCDMTDRIYFCEGSVRVGGATFRDIHPHDKDLNLREAIMKLPNSYFIQLAVEIGGPRLQGIWNDLRLPHPADSPWSITLAQWCPGDSAQGNEEKVHDVHRAFAALGQGRNRISLLDSACIMSAVASGVVREPLFTLDGKPADPVSLEERGIDARELDLIRKGLLDAVGPGGTASKARLDGIQVAGIPATAIVMTQGSEELYGPPQPMQRSLIASFTGYAPFEQPRYVVAVRIEDGGSNAGSQPFYGGTVAAPLAARLLQALLTDEE